MNVLLIIAFFVVFTVFNLQIAYGEILYGSNSETGIFVTFDDNLSKIVYKSALGTSEHYDLVVKELKSGTFVLKSPEIAVWGHPQGNGEYLLTVMTFMGFEKFTVSSVNWNSVVDTPKETESKEIEPEKTGNSILEEYWSVRDLDIVRSSEQEREIIPPEEKEIVIITQKPHLMPWRTNFIFDLIVLDPTQNQIVDYHSDNGRISDAEITGTIKDVNGVVLKSFSGITSESGHFADSVYIPYNINTNGAFTLEIFGTKVFDGNTATYSILEEFFVYAPSTSSSSKVKCPVDQIFNGTSMVCEDL